MVLPRTLEETNRRIMKHTVLDAIEEVLSHFEKNRDAILGGNLSRETAEFKREWEAASIQNRKGARLAAIGLPATAAFPLFAPLFIAGALKLSKSLDKLADLDARKVAHLNELGFKELNGGAEPVERRRRYDAFVSFLKSQQRLTGKQFDELIAHSNELTMEKLFSGKNGKAKSLTKFGARRLAKMHETAIAVNDSIIGHLNEISGPISKGLLTPKAQRLKRNRLAIILENAAGSASTLFSWFSDRDLSHPKSIGIAAAAIGVGFFIDSIRRGRSSQDDLPFIEELRLHYGLAKQAPGQRKKIIENRIALLHRLNSRHREILSKLKPQYGQ